MSSRSFLLLLAVAAAVEGNVPLAMANDTAYAEILGEVQGPCSMTTCGKCVTNPKCSWCGGAVRGAVSENLTKLEQQIDSYSFHNMCLEGDADGPNKYTCVSKYLAESDQCPRTSQTAPTPVAALVGLVAPRMSGRPACPQPPSRPHPRPHRCGVRYLRADPACRIRPFTSADSRPPSVLARAVRREHIHSF